VILDRRSERRDRPDPRRWSRAQWEWEDAGARRSRNDWILLVGGGLTAIALVAGIQLLSQRTLPGTLPKPEWIKLEPPRLEPAAAPPSAAPARTSAAAPATPSDPQSPTPQNPQPLGETHPDGSGEMAVIQGSSQGIAPEDIQASPPSSSPSGESSGPVAIQGVPASVAPLLPGYPVRAEAEGREGTVVALVVTDTSGRVVELRIEKSAGRDFDESVRRAALASRFLVPRRNGKAVAVAFRMPYRFRLD